MYEVILWLNSTDKSVVTQQHVVKHAKIDKMMMSDLVTTLVQKKLLQRLPHKVDKYAYALALTNKGWNLALKATPIVKGIDKEFFSTKTTGLMHLVNNLHCLVNTKTE